MQFLQSRRDEVVRLGFTPDGARLVGFGRTGLYEVWQFPEGVLQGSFETTAWPSSELEFSSDGRFLVLLSTEGDEVGRLYNLETACSRGTPLTVLLSGFSRDVEPFTPKSARFSKDGTKLDVVVHRRYDWTYSNNVDQLVFYRWEVSNKRRVKRIISDLPESAGVSGHWELDPGRTWVAMSNPRQLMFWNFEKLRVDLTVKFPQSVFPSWHLFSRDGRRLALVTPEMIRVHKVPHHEVFVEFANPTPMYIQSLAFSPDGHALATANNDTVVRFWETDTGRLLQTFDWNMGRLTAVTIAPDGMRAAAAGDGGKIVVWDLD